MQPRSRHYPDRNSSDRSKRGNGSRRKSHRRRRRERDSEDESNSEPSKREDDRPPMVYVADEKTRWTIAESDGDPVYVRDSDAASFVPLPRAESETRPSLDPRIEEHFIGVRTSEEAEDIVKADDFVLYYRKEDGPELQTSIPLYLAHRNTRNKLFHFPIIRSTDESGAQWWHVQLSPNIEHSFRQLSRLVRCYHLYRFTDARTGRMEVFPLWRGGILDDFT
ncbi:hypothetical protein Q1695_010218 [Nippostrongylus brasiliensis]|nr:hypothetical protein Q1695_010218 [Nippostrongylus brasiliensis]